MEKKSFPIARVIGIGVLGIAGLGILLLWLAVTLSDAASPGAQETEVFDRWKVLFDDYIPPVRVMVAAIIVALIVVFIAATVERHVTNSQRRSSDGGSVPLAPKIVMAEYSGVFQGPITVIVLLAAHNEAQRITGTIKALKS